MKSEIKKNLILALVVVLALQLTACDLISIRKKGDIGDSKNVKTYDVFGDGSKVIKIEDDVIYGDKKDMRDIFPQIPIDDDDATNQGDDSATPSITYKMDKGLLDMCTILEIKLNGKEPYYENTRINDGSAFLYVIPQDNDFYKGKTITVNAGHGVKGGSKEKTYSHPDKSPKIGSGTNKAGDVMSFAISEGMTFSDGKLEADMNLEVAKRLRDLLLLNGYNVLMIRENDNSRLDNISRTILANVHSDIHLSIHFDSTATDKGAFILVPLEVDEYLNMEPVKTYYREDNRLANAMINEWKDDEIKLFGKGKMGMDLTQISYSTIPSVDLELGDKATEITPEYLDKLATGILHGVDNYFGEDINYEEDFIVIATDNDVNDSLW